MKSTATKFLFLSIVIFVSALGAFAQHDKLIGTEWKLTEAYGQTALKVSTAQLNIDDAGEKFSGSTGCNRMFGSVSINGKRISFGAIGTTKMMCKMIAGSIPEETFLRGMNATVRYNVSSQQLKLLDRRGRTVLKFQKIVDDQGNGSDATGIDVKKWMLESVGYRKSLVAITGVSTIFDSKKGSVGGNSGCNVYGGNYTLKGPSIVIDRIISTERACIEDGKMQTERELFDGLRKANRYEIKGGHLFLYKGEELLLTFRGEQK